MPILEFNEGDIVNISDLQHGGKTGEIIRYQGIVRMQMPGQSGEQGGDDPWWVVRLKDSDVEVSILQSDLTLA